jgi:hypothetical protein
MIKGYEEKYVVFIDILGFKNIIKDTVADKRFYEKIYEILTRAYLEKPLRHLFYEDKNSKNQGVYRTVNDNEIKTGVYTFSDSILITGEIEKHTLLDIFTKINRLVGHFLDLGIFCRGGFTKGLIRDDLQVAFGPAVIDAYIIENTKAIFPRIVIDNKVIQDINDIKINRYEYIPMSFICPEMIFDGNQYYYDILNIVPNWIVHDDNCWRSPTWEEWMKRVRSNIIKNLENSEEKTLEKYIWFSKYFNEILDRKNVNNIKKIKL